MSCPPPSIDWGTTAMWGLLSAAIALTIGKVWGEIVGRREAEAEMKAKERSAEGSP